MTDDEIAEALAEFAVVEATVAEQARIRDLDFSQRVTWDRYSYIADEDWRTFNGLT